MAIEDLPVIVEEVTEPKIATKDDPNPPAVLKLSFTIMVSKNNPQDPRELSLPAFLKLANPDSDRIMEQLTKDVSKNLRPELVGRK